MKRPFILSLVALVLAVAALLLWRSGSESPLESTSAREAAPGAGTGAAAGADDGLDGLDGLAGSRGAPLAEESTLEPEAELARRALAAADVVDEPGDAAPASAPLCRVTGTVVDERGQPLAGVALGLTGRAWPQGSGARPIPHHDGGDNALGFEVQSDASGRFEFAVPPPLSAPQRLSVGRDRFRASLVVHFGLGGADSRPSLAAGTVDLGTMQLATAGAVRGRVVDASGRPIADALVRTGPIAAAWDEVAAATASDGTFALGHVPVGSRVVTATAPGHRRAELGSVVVEAGRETAGLELVLERAPTIAGQVRDESGAPIADAKVVAWPIASGSGATVFTDADGRFELHLPQGGAHALAVSREGFARWGGNVLGGQVVEPDGAPLEIAMRALAPLQVSVVDARTGAALTRFGVRVVSEAGSAAAVRNLPPRTPPIAQEHTDGRVVVFAEPGVDLLQVGADGYVTVEVDAADASSGVPQVVRLVPSGRVTGRILADGAPVADAEVTLTEGTLESAVPGVPAADSTAPGTQTWFRPGRGAVLRTRTDAEGRFALEPTRAATALLVADVGPARALEHGPIAVTGDGHLDLGDLHAIASGRIVGSVLVADGVDPTGLVVRLDERAGAGEVLVDARGAFEFVDVAPGAHLVRLLGRSGVLGEAPGVAVDVPAGGAATVAIDARDRTLGAVELTLVATGTDVAGRDIVLLSSTGTVNTPAGPADAAGTCRAFVRTGVPVHAAVWFEHGLLTLADQTFVARAGELVGARADFGVGRLHLVLPRGLVLPDAYLVSLRVASTEATGRTQDVMVPVAGGAASGATLVSAADGSLRLSIGDVLAGACSVDVGVTDLTDPDAAPLHTSTHALRIEPGGEATLELP